MALWGAIGRAASAIGRAVSNASRSSSSSSRSSSSSSSSRSSSSKQSSGSGGSSAPISGVDSRGFSYGYNPYNGNFYGDPNLMQRDSQGRQIVNIKTGELYSDRRARELAEQAAYEKAFADRVYASGNQAAIDRLEYNRKARAEGRPTLPTTVYDFRGYAYDGNTSMDGRIYNFDWNTGQETGNLNLANPDYDLMRDPNYQHWKSYNNELWNNYYKALVTAGQLEDNRDNYDWLMSFQNAWNNKRMGQEMPDTRPDGLQAQFAQAMQYYNPNTPMATTSIANPYTPAATAPVTQDPSRFGNEGRGTPEQIARNDWLIQNDPNFVESEIARTQNVIRERAAAGMDISLQQNYLNRLYQARRQFQQTPVSGGIPVDAGVGLPMVSGTGGASASPSPTTDALLEMLFQQLQGGQVNYESMREDARRQADAWARQQNAYLDLALQQLNNRYNQGLRSIESGLADAAQSLEDNYFQQWLQARQSMANRGLAGSGLASDQDTRLMLAKQRDLAGMYRDAEQQRMAMLDALNTGQLQIELQRMGIDPSMREEEIFSRLVQNSSAMNSGNTEAARILASLIPTFLNHESVSATDRLRHQEAMAKLGWDMQKFEREMGFKYDQLNADARQFYDKMMNDRELELMRLFGHDGNGNVTLDYRKFEEQVRSNRANEALKGRQISLGYANLNARIQKDMAQLQLSYDKIANENNNRSIRLVTDSLRSIADQNYRQAQTLLEQYNDPMFMSRRKEIKSAYEDAMKRARLAHEEIMKINGMIRDWRDNH